MTTIEKIRTEIERIMNRAMNDEGRDLCNYILSFIEKIDSRPCKTSELTMTRLVALAKKKFPEVPQEFWDGLGVSDTDNVTIIIRP